jgi:hypothetical protein
MRAAAVGRLIHEELSHIPRSHKGSTQNVFRMLYTYHRRRDLAEDPSAPARNALHAAIRSVEAGGPPPRLPLSGSSSAPGAAAPR